MNVFILGSEAYHDYYRWPLKDRKVFEKWKRETVWGRLFERYASGPIGPSGAGATQPGAGVPPASQLRVP